MRNPQFPETLIRPPSPVQLERMVSLLGHENSYLRARLREADRAAASTEIARLTDANSSLSDQITNLELHIADQEALIAELDAARNDIERVLHKIGQTPLAWIFRRWAGYRLMEQRWKR